MNDGALGILGGTFDPIHHGHLRLGLEAMDALAISTVRLIPAGVPPLRAMPVASAADRLEMARLAVASEPRFVIDSGEVTSTEVSYTVDTLLRLREELGARQPLCLLLGVDAFTGLTGWSRWEQLFELAHVAIASRAGVALATAALAPPLAEQLSRRLHDSPACLGDAPCGFIVRFNMSALDISASAIRRSLALGASPRYLLPDAVLDYIESNRLYRREPDGR